MLKYDTCLDSVYHAFALIVTADETSDYSSIPTLQYRWSPSSTAKPAAEVANGNGDAEKTEETSGRTAEAIKLWQYTGQGGPHTFWRFKLEVPQSDQELAVVYSVDGQPHADTESVTAKESKSFSFFVPSKTQNFRWAGHSCNGFSAGIDTAAFNGPDPLWDDMLNDHAKAPFHAVIGGGDQSE
jgi:hypothetical protein